jgi:hypothetical protein
VTSKSEPDEHVIKEIKEIEAIAVLACQGRLDRKMLDFEARSEVMGQEQYDRYMETRESINQAMQDQQTLLGQLTAKIASHPSVAAEAILQGNFVRLANAIESRLAGPIADGESVSGTFQSLGEPYMWNDSRLKGLPGDQLNHKIDILMHGVCSQGTNDRMWNRALSFGEVKKTAAEDLKDSLLGQVMVYVVSRSGFRCNNVTIA